MTEVVRGRDARYSASNYQNVYLVQSLTQFHKRFGTVTVGLGTLGWSALPTFWRPANGRPLLNLNLAVARGAILSNFGNSLKRWAGLNNDSKLEGSMREYRLASQN